MSKTIFYNVLEKISKFDKQVQYFYYSQYLFFINFPYFFKIKNGILSFL